MGAIRFRQADDRPVKVRTITRRSYLSGHRFDSKSPPPRKGIKIMGRMFGCPNTKPQHIMKKWESWVNGILFVNVANDLR